MLPEAYCVKVGVLLKVTMKLSSLVWVELLSLILGFLKGFFFLFFNFATILAIIP